MEEVLQQLESLEKKTRRAGDASSGLMADLLPVGSSRVGEVEAHFPTPQDDATHPLPLSGAWWWVDREEGHAPTHPRQQVVGTYFDLSNAFLSDTERTYDRRAKAGDEATEEKYARMWARPMERAPFHLEPSRPHTTIKVATDKLGSTGRMWKEVPVLETDTKATNSTSLLRAPASISDFAKGSSSNFPFMPGGMEREEPLPRPAGHPREAAAAEATFDLDVVKLLSDALNGANLYTVAPGLDRGLNFDSSASTSFSKILQDNVRAAEAAEEKIMADAQPSAGALQSEPVEEAPAGQGLISFADIFVDDGIDPFRKAPGGEEEESEEESEEGEEEEEEGKGKEKKDEVAKAKAPAAAAGVTEEADHVDHLLGEDDLLSVLRRPAGAPRKRKDEWAIMDNSDVSNFEEIVPEMALEYPFDLDVFQKRAVCHLENGESVFVAAHTSAGKTVVAEYAIALASKHMTRTIYTSPIKALSNQKYRDFKETFGDVGLITGDVQIKPEASCLILTTEILRSMLYRGADLIRDVEWVIFDEVHYVNDIERGVVWEEVIIMLPDHVNLILLSATVPNTLEFADWIGRTKKKNIFVITTNKRPVPLEHYLWVSNERFKIVDNRSNFLMGGYQSAMQAAKQKQSKSAGATAKAARASGVKQQRTKWVKMIDQLRVKGLLPVVVFAFSKKKCEDVAHGLTSTDLTTSVEKHEIHVFMEAALDRLKGPDRKLPQVLRIKDLLKRGIGVHHGGLLPIIKEMVEILFGRGKIKVLFATETFAMGVNMPARTVVFENVQKHDGRAFRELHAGEYIQMSGRAGRRGLDTVGTVIIMTKEDKFPPSAGLQTMILGKPQKLESQFRLTYNMILNLLRVEDFKVEDMMKRSFSEFFTQRTLPQQRQKLILDEAKLSGLQDLECLFGEPDIENYYQLASQKKQLDAECQRTIMASKVAQAALGAGRVVWISTAKYPINTVALIIGSKKAPAAPKSTAAASRDAFFEDAPAEPVVPEKIFRVLVVPDAGNDLYASAGGVPMAEAIEVTQSEIVEITSQRLKVEAGKLAPPGLDKKELASVTQQLIRLQESSVVVAPVPAGKGGPAPKGKKGGGGGGGGGADKPLETLHPVRDFKINDLEFADKWMRRERMLERMKQSKCHTCPKLKEQYVAMEQRQKLVDEISELRRNLSNENLQLMPEFQQRVSVLRFLNYVDDNNAVQLKGRVAREINTVKDELIATELIFENALTELPAEEIIALFSALVFELKTDVEVKLGGTLEEGRLKMLEIGERLFDIQTECGLDLSRHDYLKNLNFGLVEVVYEWARGMPFADITGLTDVAEGSIVRTIVRLDETCKEIKNAARIIGDSRLYVKMEEASRLVKRDIVFASSLYYDK